MILIKSISASQTYAIRKEVLRDGLDLPVVFDGDTAVTSFHLGAFDQNELVAVSSYLKTNNPEFQKEQYQLRGMATRPAHRGKGCGKAMLLKAEEMLQEKECQLLWFNAREVALNFYIKLGYQVLGDPFDIPVIGLHYVMFKKL